MIKEAHKHQWRSLAFLHWRVEASVLRALVPEPLEIDTFDGSAYVGLVLFTMPRILVRGIKVPTANAFHETNVRTYVRHKGKPGVFFFSLDAASALAVIGARLFWGLPYFKAEMSLHVRDGEVHYESHRQWPKPKPSMSRVAIKVGENEGVSPPGSLAHFLLERYFLFTVKKDRAFAGRVIHSPYPACEASLIHCEQSLVQAAGIQVSGPPIDVRFSSGVDVEVAEMELL